MRIPLMVSPVLASVALLAACNSAPPVPYEKAALENEVNGFRVAVVDVCLQSAIAGTPVSAMAGEDGPIVPAMMASAGEGAMWSPRNAQDILIRENGRTCEVTTTGVVTKAAQTSVEEALNDPHGFIVEKSVGEQDRKQFSKKVGDHTYRVTLAGAGMAGHAPSSKLVATVTSTPA